MYNYTSKVNNEIKRLAEAIESGFKDNKEIQNTTLK